MLPLELRVGRAIVGGLGVQLVATEALSITPSSGNASVDVRQGFVVLEATYDLAPPSSRLIARPLVGGGVFLLEGDGHAAAPKVALHPRFAGAMLDFGGAFGVRIHPALAVIGDLRAIVLDPEPQVTVPGATIFRTGRPAASGTLGLELRF
jgi:hypothetical protein